MIALFMTAGVLASAFMWLAADPLSWIAVAISAWIGYRPNARWWWQWPVVALVATIISPVVRLGPVELVRLHPYGVQLMLMGYFAGLSILCFVGWRSGYVLAKRQRRIGPPIHPTGRMFPTSCAALVLIIIGFHVAGAVTAEEPPPGASFKIVRGNELLLNQTDATSEHIAFATALSDEPEHVGIAIWGLQTRQVQILAPEAPYERYRWPKFSKADLGMVFVTAYDDTLPRQTTLLRCRLNSGVCSEVLTMKGEITEPVEVPDGVLFVFRPPHPDFERWGFWSSDFYLLDRAGKIRRLTHYGLAVLAYVSVLEDHIIAGAHDSRWVQSRLDPTDPIGASSEIIRLRYSKGARISHERLPIRPYVWGDTRGPAAQPSARAGSPLLAFRNAQSEKGGYRYNLVVHNMDTGERRHVRSQTRMPSRPIVLDEDRVLYFDYERDIYSFQIYSLSEHLTREVARLTGSLLRLKADRQPAS